MKQETVVNSKQVSGNWMGVLMIFVGLIFLMGTSGVTIGGYSPSLLIGVVPVILIGVSAYRQYKAEGGLTRRVLGIAVFAVLPLAFMAAMALGHSISGLWPLGAIVAGVAFILFSGGK